MTQNRQPPAPPPIRPKKTKTKATERTRTAGTSSVSPKKKTSHPAKKTSSRGRGKPKSHKPARKELSAGGVVARKERGTWMVALLKTEHRRGQVWVLPKGHVETHASERVSQAARREVEEESGVTDLSVKDQLGVTRFVFQADDALVKKTVHYFLMTTSQKTLIPQEEEDLFDAQWFPIDVAIDQLEYDTDQDIVRKAKEKLTGIKQPKKAKKNGARPRKGKQKSGGKAPRIH